MRADRENPEKSPSDIIEQLKRLPAKKIVLFGSLGRGRVRAGSDIGLLVLFDDRDHFKSRMKRLYSVIESDVDFDVLP